MSQTESAIDTVPPFSPENEAKAPENLEFVMDSLSQLNKLKSMGVVEPGVHLLTTNAKWGLVLRVDFTINHVSNPGFVNRLICWKDNTGKLGTAFAIGQNLPPLQTQT